MAKKKKRSKRKFNARKFILNCDPSAKTETDWGFEDAAASDAISMLPQIPRSKDLRKGWWRINDQGSTGACVGFAAAYGVLRWHYVKKGLLTTSIRNLPSARFIWMADKETDEITSFPTTFIEKAGTQTKLALRVARNYGCVLEKDLPMNGSLSMLKSAVFYAKAADLRIRSYYNLGNNLKHWRLWLAFVGPILTRLGVDRTWDNATNTGGHLDVYRHNTVRGGHAVCLVGYTDKYFIVRNSWGTDWGDRGFGYASDNYAQAAFSDAYGAVV